jgi:FtsH-binding integral membrane protein
VNHQKTKDEITLKSTSKMMHSAIFGQLIIIIVFIPILSLVGIEGKMFKPMALVFCFALIGAMLFCVTYLPVVSSLVLKANVNAHNTWSFKIIEKIKIKYSLLLEWVLLHRKKVLIAAVVLMIAVIANIFLRMPVFYLMICGAFVVFSSLMILWQLHQIVRGGETNYISATLTLYISIYNLFTSLLQIILAFSGNDRR